MKLTNHNKNNAYSMKDGSVMRGTITMTRVEFANASRYLDQEYKKAKRNCNTYVRDCLGVTTHEITRDFKDTLRCLGVCATQLLANKYHLKGYKDQNYGIKII
jgi:hypothetical protein